MPYRDPRRQREANRAAVARYRARKRAAVAALVAARAAEYEPLPADLASWCQKLIVTQGHNIGEPLNVLPWQREYLRRAEALQGGELGLTVAAGSGKTTLAAAVAAAAVAGPLAQPRASVLAVAGSFGQARLLFDHALAFLRPVIDREPARFRVLNSESTAAVIDRQTGAELRCREAAARTLHGAAPGLVIADEPAQWARTQSEAIYGALRSRLGKVPGARLLAIGTRPAENTHWFNKLCERSGIIYAAPVDSDPFSVATWHAANPSLSYFPALREVYEREARESKADAGLLRQFRAFRLNQGTATADLSLLIDPDKWQAAEGDAAAYGPMVLGVDLGSGLSMSAAAGYWPTSGRLDAFAMLPALPDLTERGRHDAVGDTYRQMSDRAELVTTPGQAADPPALIREAVKRWGRPVAVVADRFRHRELADGMKAAGLTVPLVLRGQGYRDGSEDVRDFRVSVARGEVTPAVSLLLRFAMSGAVTVSDPAGNAKLARASEGNRRQRHRDDAAAAAVLAVAYGHRNRQRDTGPRWRSSLV